MSLNTLPFNPFPPSSDQKGSGGGSYVLPIASAETLGGIKVGDNLTVEEDGTLNAADPYSPPDYSTTVFDTGRKWIDGKRLYGKVVNLGNLPNATSTAVAAGMSAYDVLMIDGWYQGATCGNMFNLAALQNFAYNPSGDEVIVNVSSDLSSYTGVAIVYGTEKTV